MRQESTVGGLIRFVPDDVRVLDAPDGVFIDGDDDLWRHEPGVGLGAGGVPGALDPRPHPEPSGGRRGPPANGGSRGRPGWPVSGKATSSRDRRRRAEIRAILGPRKILWKIPIRPGLIPPSSADLEDDPVGPARHVGEPPRREIGDDERSALDEGRSKHQLELRAVELDRAVRARPSPRRGCGAERQNPSENVASLVDSPSQHPVVPGA